MKINKFKSRKKIKYKIKKKMKRVKKKKKNIFTIKKNIKLQISIFIMKIFNQI